MRGKNILWLCMIAMFLGTMMVNVDAPVPTEPQLKILPKEIPGRHRNGQPGDVFQMSVEIYNVANLWSIGFEIHIAPYSSVLAPSDLTEGDFLSEGWPPPEAYPPGAVGTKMATNIDAFNGIIYVTVARLEQYGPPWPPFFGEPLPREGRSGSGTIMTFKLTVIEAGPSPVKLVNSILNDVDGNNIAHKTKDSKYLGSYARLKAGTRVPKEARVGEMLEFTSDVENRGDRPLYIRVRFDLERMDGRRIEIRSGQTYGGGGLGEPLPFEWKYADGYIGGFEDPPGAWSNPGAAVGPPDGIYSESTGPAGATTGFYTFEDVSLAGREIQNIDLRGYTSQPDGVDNDFDPIAFGFNEAGDLVWAAWCDSMGGSFDWAWTGGRYYEGTQYDMPEYYGTEVHQEVVFNSMIMYIEYYEVSPGDRLRLDSLRWKVEYAAITPVTPPRFLVQPGQRVTLDVVSWPVTIDHIGEYQVTATIEYSFQIEDPEGGPDLPAVHWNSWAARGKDTQKTFMLEIKE